MKNSSYSKYLFFVVAASNAINVISGFMINILATQVLTVEDYGFYKAFIVSLQLFASILNFGLHYSMGREYAIGIDKNIQNKMHSSVIVIYVGLNLFLSILMYILSLLIKFMFGFEIPVYIVISSYFVFILLLQNYFMQKYQGQNKMLSFSFVNAFSNIFNVMLLGITLILKFEISIELFLSFFVISNTLFYVLLIIKERFTVPKTKDLLYVNKINKNVGLQLYVGSLFTVSIGYLLSTIVAGYSGLEEYAFFALANSFAAPLIYIPATYTTLRFKSYANINKIKIKEIAKVIILTMTISALYYLLLTIAVPKVIGINYQKAVQYSAFLIFYYVLIGVGDYFNRFIYAKGYGKLLRNNSFIVGSVLLITAIFGIYLLNIEGLIYAKMFSGIIYVLLMIKSYKKITMFLPIDEKILPIS